MAKAKRKSTRRTGNAWRRSLPRAGVGKATGTGTATGVGHAIIAATGRAGKPRGTKNTKRKWRQDRIRPVVKELWPNGPPETIPTVELKVRLGAELESRNIPFSDSSMERPLTGAGS